MKYICLILLTWLSIKNQASQGLYACKNVNITLFSSAPLEDIQASTNSGTSVYNPTTGDLAFSVNIRSFRFPKSLMQEHFNENYMESDKYPKASFRGKIKESIDVTKNGSYPVTATGELDVHGITQTRSITGNVVVNNGTVTLSSAFMVKCADHKIEIPTLVFTKIAESIKMNVSGTYTVAKSS